MGGGLYQELLGAEFEHLHPGVQRSLCTPLTACGVACVRWGDARMARILGMPQPGNDIAVKLEVTDGSGRLNWRRQFGNDLFVTQQHAFDSLLIEQYGITAIALQVRRECDSLRFTSVAGQLLGVRVPGTLAPRLEALLSGIDEDRWQVKVEVSTRRGMICQYEAEIEAV